MQNQWRDPRAVDKANTVVEMYSSAGCDVVFLQLRVPQHVIPYLTRPAVVELLDIVCFLLDYRGSADADRLPAAPRPLIFHVFSGGCYLFGEMLRMLAVADLQEPTAQPRETQACAAHVRAVAASLNGLFADSPVMAADTPRGLAALLSGNMSYTKPTGPKYWMLRASLAAALVAVWPFVGRHHSAASELVAGLPATVLQLASRCRYSLL